MQMSSQPLSLLHQHSDEMDDTEVEDYPNVKKAIIEGLRVEEEEEVNLSTVHALQFAICMLVALLTWLFLMILTS